MQKWFECPDGQKVEIKECLGKCRMASRCAPLPYLMLVADERKWTGKPSVTMLQRGARQTYLKITVDYTVNPSKEAFRVTGTKSHGALEAAGGRIVASETKLEVNGVTGITDLVEIQDNGSYWLVDYKVIGSYAVVKMLGISAIREVPITDENGQPVLYVRGEKKGTPKMQKVYGPDPKKADIADFMMQLNSYRMGWEERNPGRKIAALKIFAIVRDGGTKVAHGRGVDRNTYYVDIPILPDDLVTEWMEPKRDRIIRALEQKEIPPMCSEEENWEGRMCIDYCPVADACGAIGDNYHLGGNG